MSRMTLLSALLMLTLCACKTSPNKEAKARPKGPPHQTAHQGAPHPEGDAPRIDVAFCLDATASMGSLIKAAKDQILTIHQQVVGGSPKPSVRFGVVAFRDKKDDYITRLYGLTPDPKRARSALAEIKAQGGGDGPEHVVAGLRRSVSDLNWDPKAALRVLFLMGDAPPHLDYGEDSDIKPVLAAAKKGGIIIGAVAYGKMPFKGQAFWKQVADATGGPTEGISADGEQVLESVIFGAIQVEAAKKGIRY